MKRSDHVVAMTGLAIFQRQDKLPDVPETADGANADNSVAALPVLAVDRPVPSGGDGSKLVITTGVRPPSVPRSDSGPAGEGTPLRQGP